MMKDSATVNEAIVIERTFNAPVETIWRLWTDAAEVKQWYGPKGFTVPVVQMDVRVGGKRLVCMLSPDGSRKIWTTGEYKEIIPHERLVYTDCPADEQGNMLSLAAMGMGDDTQPMITEVTVLLEAIDGRTKMVMRHAGLPAGDQGASAGWEQALDKLAALTEAMRSAK
ncbi:MAG: SRPBCC domain-containing protein [Caldilineaceae bacterium]